MTRPTINKINKAISQHEVEIVKGVGYFYFAGVSEKGQMVADNIESVISDILGCNTLEEWVEYVNEQVEEFYASYPDYLI